MKLSEINKALKCAGVITGAYEPKNRPSGVIAVNNCDHPDRLYQTMCNLGYMVEGIYNYGDQVCFKRASAAREG